VVCLTWGVAGLVSFPHFHAYEYYQQNFDSYDFIHENVSLSNYNDDLDKSSTFSSWNETRSLCPLSCCRKV